MSMDYDLFLSFLSEKGSGSWREFKDAWAWLGGAGNDDAEKAWIAAQSLSALGHIEVAWGDEIEWAVAPPVLTMIPRSGGRALLTGARTRHLLEVSPKDGTVSGAFEEAAESRNLWVDNWRQPYSPSTVMLCCESHRDAEGLAGELGVAYTYSASHQLSSILPDLASYEALWQAGDLPRGLEAERFNPGSLFWDPVEETAGHGLYRVRTYAKHVHALNGPTGWFRIPREIGQYEVLRWEEAQVLSYSRKRVQFSVRMGARLPPLHDRAATLCSGRLPLRVSRNGLPWLTYENVDEVIAQRIAASLCQQLAYHDA